MIFIDFLTILIGTVTILIGALMIANFDLKHILAALKDALTDKEFIISTLGTVVMIFGFWIVLSQLAPL